MKFTIMFEYCDRFCIRLMQYMRASCTASKEKIQAVMDMFYRYRYVLAYGMYGRAHPTAVGNGIGIKAVVEVGDG